MPPPSKARNPSPLRSRRCSGRGLPRGPKRRAPHDLHEGPPAAPRTLSRTASSHSSQSCRQVSKKLGSRRCP
eukprot:579041-Alexandrium_andersonii.AAC.1